MQPYLQIGKELLDRSSFPKRGIPMIIKVRLFATLRTGRDKEVFVEGSAGMTCRTITEKLSIPEKEVSILLVNGRNAKLDYVLLEDDVVSIFPPVGGG
jgi:molybdopterin synthase sulfur carrier subunit